MLSSYDSFQSASFNLKDYIEELTKSAESLAKNQPPLPGQELLPFINSFETALHETRRLYESIEERVAEQTRSLTETTGELYLKSIQLSSTFERTFHAFTTLEKRFDQVDSMAMRSGQQIDRLHHERRRALEALEIIQYFVEFMSGKSSGKLEAMLYDTSGTGGIENRVRGAKILQRLVRIAKTDIPGTEGGRSLIEALAERVENDLLQNFHAAFDEGNTDAMRIAASVLVSFNGGQSCIHSFVSQHAFFMEPTVPENIITRYHSTIQLEPINFSKPEILEPVIEKLYSQIATTAEADWKYLAVVFQRPSMVMNRLLTRIFHEPVQVHVEETLRQSKSHSTIAYLRTLDTIVKATRKLVQDLAFSYAKYVNASNDVNPSKLAIEDDYASGQLTKGVGSAPGEEEEVAPPLETLANDLFSPYLDTDSYAQCEVRSLSELFCLAISPLQIFANDRKQTARSKAIFARVASANQSSDSNAPLIENLNRAFLYIFDDNQRPLVVREEGGSGVPSVAVVERCLVLFREALLRIFDLPPLSKRSDIITNLFTKFLDCLLTKYVDASIDILLEYGEFGNTSKLGFEPLAFDIVSATNAILGVIQLFFQNIIAPIVVTVSADCYRQLVELKSTVFTKTTEKADNLLKKQLEGIIEWISGSLLSRQKKTDFRPRPEDGFLMCSPTCETTVEFFRKLFKTVNQRLDKQNATSFLMEVGITFNAMLLDHLRKFTISDAGAVLLRSDLRLYSEVMQSTGTAWLTLKERFSMLCELGNIFLVRPENLRSLLQEGLLGQLEPKLLYPFLQQRADFKSARIDVLFPEIGPSLQHIFD